MGNENNNNQAPEQDINQLLKVRREKLAALQEADKDPFKITKYNQTHHTDEVKSLYEEHEAKLLEGRVKPSVDGLDEAAAREVINNDYNERRAIMDASPINVSTLLLDTITFTAPPTVSFDCGLVDIAAATVTSIVSIFSMAACT